jgi:serine/threonine-protein kinase
MTEDISVTKTMESPVEEYPRGSTFAKRYKIIEKLGIGGMGAVFRVEDANIGQDIALKLIKPDIASDKKSIERFRNELKTTRMISHRNVCRMFDLAETEGTFYITMEYVSGKDLKSFIRRSGKLDIPKAISIAKEICEGLAEAHRLGVVHRDLKSSNIMIDKEGNARIMDFGIARSLRARGLTGEGIIIGTPEYMSPEQAEAKEVDCRSDIYSLGVVLYEMVTGQLPFEGDTALSIAMKHKSEVPKDPKEYNAQIPDDFCNLILKCLEKDKNSRFQSTGEIQSELEDIEKGIPTTDRAIPRRRPLTSKEITVTFGSKKLLIAISVVIAFIIIALTIWKPWSEREEVSQSPIGLSIAVLPFEDLSPEKNHEYLGDGIAETLINALSSIKGLQTPARTSAFSFKGKDMDVREIGQMLNVKTVLEGSVQVAGDRLRITARISNVDDGYQLWSENYELQLEDIFDVQDDIVEKIVNMLKLKLIGEKESQIVKHYTVNREAYDLYMRGLYLLNKRGRENLEKAVEYFQSAIEKDPSYALAYAGLAETYVTMGDTALYLSPSEAFSKAREAAQKALEIDASLAEAHNTLAQVKYIFDWKWHGAREEFELAIALNPNYATAYKEYGEYLTKLERYDEALKKFRRAEELDPFSLPILSLIGWPSHYSGQYDKAIGQNKKVLEMDPNFSNAQFYIALSYLEKGMYEDALVWFQKANRPNWIGITYARMGKIAEAQHVLTQLLEKSKQEMSPYMIAALYFEMGDDEQGFQWLDRAYQYKDHYMVFLKIDSYFKRFRLDPRFTSLLKKIGFTK